MILECKLHERRDCFVHSLHLEQTLPGTTEYTLYTHACTHTHTHNYDRSNHERSKLL